MGKRLGIMFIGIFIFVNHAHADKIYLKDGQMLEGKVKEKSPEPWKRLCSGEDEVEVWNGNRIDCVSRPMIVKVEKEIKKPQKTTLPVNEDKWGEEKHGCKTQLIPAEEKYVIGKPMNFHLVMKNVSPDSIWYDNQGIVHDVLIVKDASGKRANYKGYAVQTAGFERPIETGEIFTLFTNRDIAREYVILEPGKYTIQFREGNDGMPGDSSAPPSNIVEFEILAGTPRTMDILIDALSRATPDAGWQVFPFPFQDGLSIFGRNPFKGISVQISRSTGGKGDIAALILWQINEPAEVAAGKKEGQEGVSEFLGSSASGEYYYLHTTDNVKNYWPSARKNIMEALKLKK